MTVTEFLRSRVPFLAGLGAEEARELALAVEQRQFSAGQTIVFQGATVDGLHILAAGAAAVWRTPGKGRAAVSIAQLSPGDVFGEISILESGTATASIKADADDTLVFVLPQSLLDSRPALQSRLRELAAARRAEKPSSGVVSA